MSAKQRNHIRAEIAAVERILDGMPDDNGVDRLSMESRLADLRHELATTMIEVPPCASPTAESGWGNEASRVIGSVRPAESSRHERAREFSGHFQGFLPTCGDFEFVDHTDGSVINGTVQLGCDRDDAIRIRLDITATVTLVERRDGNGRIRIVLIDQPLWHDIE